MPADNTTNKIKFDISELKAGITESNRLIKLANSEFKAAASGMENWENSTEGLEAKLKQLNTVQAEEEKKLKNLKKQYEQVVEEQGATSAGAVKLAIRINNQQAAVNKVNGEMGRYESRLDTVKGAQAEAERSGRELVDVLKDIDKAAGEAEGGVEGAADGFTVVKGALADLISNAIQAGISKISELASALMELPEATKEYRTTFAAAKQSAEDSVIGIEGAKKAYEEFYSVAADEGQAAEATSHLAGLVSTNEELQGALDGVIGAWVEYGDSISIEGLAEAANETARTGAITGQFADALNWAGESEEEFQKKLDECSTEQERQQLVVKTLNDLYGENAEKYKENNKSVLDANAANLHLLESQSAMAEVIEPLTALWTNLKAQGIEAITPAIEFLSTKIQDLTKWLSEHETAATVLKAVVMGLAAGFGVLATALLISNLISAVQKAFALLNITMLANPIVLIIAAIAGLVVAFITLWKKSESFRNFWIKLWDKITGAFGKAKDGIIKGFNAVVEFFKTMPGKIWNAIIGAVSKIKDWGNRMKEKAIDAGQKVITGITGKLKTIPGKVLSIGGDVVNGLWDGITNKADWLKKKISGFVGNITKWLKKFFKIGSPSKLMRDEIGRFLPEGIAVGVEDFAFKAINAVKNLSGQILGAAEISGLTVPQLATGAAGAGGGVVNNITFNQTNNSPTALSRVAVYRDTKQLLRQIKRVK